MPKFAEVRTDSSSYGGSNYFLVYFAHPDMPLVERRPPNKRRKRIELGSTIINNSIIRAIKFLFLFSKLKVVYLYVRFHPF